MIISLVNSSKVFILLVLFGLSAAAQAEVIQKFEADYTITESGEVKVVETITYDFESEERHGIFRTILNKHPQPATAWFKSRSIDLEVQNVTKDGQPEPYAIDKWGKEVEIKIGDEDVSLSGVHTYVINYTVKGALSYGEMGAEFYYNVTGNDWEVPITLAVAKVTSEAFASKMFCYQGESGSTNTCTNSMRDSNAIIFTANNLESGEGLTVAAELDPNKVSYVIHEEISWVFFGFILSLLWISWLLYYCYRFRYVHYKKMTVVAQYEPYKNFLPMYTGYLFDNILDPRDITAGILYLAEQGFIKITKTTKQVLLIFPTHDYSITLLKPLSDIPSKFLTKVSELLFTTDTTVGTSVLISTLAKERAKNAERIMYLKKDLETDLKENGFLESTYTSVAKYVLPVLALLAVVFGGLLFVTNGVLVVVFVFAITIIIGAILLIPRKTAAWFEAKNHTEGFKLFLSVTDKERFDFHNAPEKSPELFMQYLPYAVALGVEDKWAKVFEGITIPQPDWYEGGNFAAFNAGVLTSDLGAFSTALSTNSGVSGSSGGGSSGGGGGGGGGGSW